MGGSADCRLLGPLEVRFDGTPVPITAPMQRAVLASLLTRSGELVPVTTVAADLWGHNPPPSAVTTIRNYVRRLRAALPHPLLCTGQFGYRVSVDLDRLDTTRFAELVKRARALRSADLYEQALSLWRGEPLCDVRPSPLREAFAARWNEEYLTVFEELMELRLRARHHGGLIGTLRVLAWRHPMREQLNRQLMTALYLEGRAAEALDHFRHLREHLVCETGLEPGPALRQLHATMLRGDPLPNTTGDQAEPVGITNTGCGLPAPSVEFVGREEEIDDLCRLLDATEVPGPRRCVVYGPAGCGKSALALQVGHRIADRFSGGVRYVDLRGTTPGVVARSTADVLTGLLSDLGAPVTGTESIAELITSYRASLRGRRHLMILDNATDPTRVEPLMTDEPGSAMIVTSRLAPRNFGAAYHVGLLRHSEGVDLIRRIIGTRKVRDEPEMASRIVALCGHLPLAIQLIAHRAAHRPYWPLRTWVDRLEQETSRLNHLCWRGVDVRASLAISVHELQRDDDPVARDASQLLPQLAAAGNSRHTLTSVVRRTQWSAERAENALLRLTDAQLAYSPSPGHYLVFDLVALVVRDAAPTA